MWEDHSNLKFKHNICSLDILISNKYVVHRFQKIPHNLCSNPLDGRCSILVHAFFPAADCTTDKIQINSAEDWCLEKGK